MVYARHRQEVLDCGVERLGLFDFAQPFLTFGRTVEFGAKAFNGA